MRIVTLLALTAALAPSGRAQADTTAAWRYMPLQVGNRWEYSYSYTPAPQHWPNEPYPPLQLQAYWRWLVTDQTTVEGTPYFTLRRERYNTAGAFVSATTEQVRFDTLRAQVVHPDGTAFEHAPCPLDRPFFGTISGGCGGQYFSGNGWGYGWPVLGTTASVKRLMQGIGTTTLEYAAGIGLSRSYCDLEKGNAQYDFMLHYARVGSARYGTPVPILPVVVAAEPEAPPAALTLRASPNPTAGPLVLTLALPAAGPVTVEAFDVTGRMVYHATPTLAAGAHTLDVDAAGWAPGLYVVRATTADGATATTRLSHH